MSVRGIVSGLAGAAREAARNPMTTAKRVAESGAAAARNPVSTARRVVSHGAAASEGVAHTAADRLRVRQGRAASAELQADPSDPIASVEPAEVPQQPQARDVSDATVTPEPGPAESKTAAKKSATRKSAESPAKKSTAKKSAAKKAPAKKAPEIVLDEPGPPAEPPVDVVGQALAAEADDEGFGRTTEPRGASRDAEHGEAQMQRAETEEIAEESAEAFPEGNLDIDTPAHTTGADVGFNPDTAEASLEQPETEPLVDPSATKSVKAEADTLSKAAEPEKE